MGYTIKRVTPDFVKTSLPEIASQPYTNAFFLADLLQLYNECEFYAAFDGGRLSGMLSYYTDIPYRSVRFYCPDADSIPALLGGLRQLHPNFGNDPFYTIAEARFKDYLDKHGLLLNIHTEYRMRYSTERMKLRGLPPEIEIARLSEKNIGDISRIYSVVPAMTWTPKLLIYGPYYGAFDRTSLVAIAGVHFNTRYSAEVGNIVCLPMYRRKGLAKACTQAVVNELKRNEKAIFLRVSTENTHAINMYLSMGFEVTDTVYLCKFLLSPISKDATV